MQNSIERAAALLQEAALGREPLSACLVAIGKLIDADASILWSPVATQAGGTPYVLENFDEERVQEYMSSYFLEGRDLALNILLARKQFRAVNRVEDLMPSKPYLRSELYNDFYRRLGTHEWLVGLSTPDYSRHGIVDMQMTFGRGSKRGAFGKEEVRTLKALSPHLNAAMLLFSERRRLAHESLAAAFEDAADAVAILNGDGLLRYSNTAFHALQRQLDPAGRRQHERPLESAAFKPVASAFFAARLEASESGLAANRCEFVMPGAPARRFVCVVSNVLTAAGFVARGRERLFLLVLRESTAVQDERVAALRARYKLTTAEAQVLRRFADGADLREIAALLGVTIHTVRAQVKSLLTKTGCRRQSQLAQLLDTALTGRLRLNL